MSSPCANRPQYRSRVIKPGNYEVAKAWFGDRPADGIGPSEIAAKLTSQARCAATFNRFRVAINHVYKITVENGHRAFASGRTPVKFPVPSLQSKELTPTLKNSGVGLSVHPLSRRIVCMMCGSSAKDCQCADLVV
jgi:hypothetical protein